MIVGEAMLGTIPPQGSPVKRKDRVGAQIWVEVLDLQFWGLTP
jgi:hypothetical protein